MASRKTERAASHNFRTAAGWDERYSRRGRLRGAGTKTHTGPGNRQFYRVKRDAIDRCLDEMGASLAGKRVLDAAGGSGQFVEYFLRRGAAHVTVADFSRKSLDQAAAAYGNDPRIETLHLDMTDVSHAWENQYDFAFVMEAIFLLPNDDDLARAIENLGRALVRGGYLLISDVFPPRSVQVNDYVTWRALPFYESLLKDNGMEVVGFVPQTYLFNRRMFSIFQPLVEAVPGLMYYVDRWAMRRGWRPPPFSQADVKYLIARKKK